jgi:hypothetical protein
MREGYDRGDYKAWDDIPDYQKEEVMASEHETANDYWRTMKKADRKTDAADAIRFRWWAEVRLASPEWEACASALPSNPTVDDYRKAIDTGMANSGE